MALHVRMELQFRQELQINPRLYQAMDLLQMPMLDLQVHLKQELMINPFLEMAEEAEEGVETTDEDEDEDEEEAPQEDEIGDSEDSGDDQDSDADDSDPSDEAVDPLIEGEPDEGDLTSGDTGDIDWDEILKENDNLDYDNYAQEVDDREFHEKAPASGSSLYKHLIEQLILLKLDDGQRRIGEEIIGDIDDNGYLQSSVSEIAFRLRAAEDDVLEVLERIKTLDPVGIGARDLRECLLIQLRDKGREDELVYRLVDEFFDELSKRHWQDIAKSIGLGLKEIQDAADQIAQLEPKPGRLISESRDDNYVVPDMVVEKVEGDYIVYINDFNLPRLRLSRAYREIARDKKQFKGDTKDFIYKKLNSANWLIQAIEQRKQTMLKVMNYIVDKQHNFFEHGISHLKPLTLREVSEAIDMHESTISRVTNDKYCQTPRGVFQLKFFFSVGLASESGEDVSARGIKNDISKMIEGEDTSKPLTDQEIVARLKEEGIRIARRTVAKYRDQMGILPARMRKRV
ncbi:MAG: RNA polymerase factor sigma-54 [Candidatus Glassbacteria bacterium]|nr:RNA polymerase factor sigma-54 [Candidatus Glassbacteria bacterium]